MGWLSTIFVEEWRRRWYSAFAAGAEFGAVSSRPLAEPSRSNNLGLLRICGTLDRRVVVREARALEARITRSFPSSGFGCWLRAVVSLADWRRSLGARSGFCGLRVGLIYLVLADAKPFRMVDGPVWRSDPIPSTATGLTAPKFKLGVPLLVPPSLGRDSPSLGAPVNGTVEG
jgi:hypothetical protein